MEYTISVYRFGFFMLGAELLNNCCAKLAIQRLAVSDQKNHDPYKCKRDRALHFVNDLLEWIFRVILLTVCHNHKSLESNGYGVLCENGTLI